MVSLTNWVAAAAAASSSASSSDSYGVEADELKKMKAVKIVDMKIKWITDDALTISTVIFDTAAQGLGHAIAALGFFINWDYLGGFFEDLCCCGIEMINKKLDYQILKNILPINKIGSIYEIFNVISFTRH